MVRGSNWVFPFHNRAFIGAQAGHGWIWPMIQESVMWQSLSITDGRRWHCGWHEKQIPLLWWWYVAVCGCCGLFWHEFQFSSSFPLKNLEKSLILENTSNPLYGLWHEFQFPSPFQYCGWCIKSSKTSPHHYGSHCTTFWADQAGVCILHIVLMVTGQAHIL